MTGADRQWELNRRNFAGRWCGESHWFLRGEDGVLDLERPSRVIPDTCYAIRFFDDDHGEWDGRGLLLAPGGSRRLALARDSYNRGGQCWQFEGAGGQSSLTRDPAAARWGHEINLFHGRSRSMLVLLWGREGPEGQDTAGGRWRLQAVGAVAFRCSLAAPSDPPRSNPRQALALLSSQRGWPGQREWLKPGPWPTDPPPPKACDPFAPEAFALHPLTAAFVDGLVCSVPEWLPDEAFTLQVGCRLSAERFDQISLRFSPDGRLERWERRCFRPGN
jgi:hypothetical protein